MSRFVRPVALAGVVVATLAAGVVAAHADVVATASPARPSAATVAAVRAGASRPFSVTLVTGDRVTVAPAPGGKYGVTVSRGKGREHIPFSIRQTKNGLNVVPADTLPLLAQNRLDPRLFDMLLLHKWKYDDAHTAELPLLLNGVRRSGTKAAAPLALAGSRTVRVVPSLGITSVKQPKRNAATFWSALTRTTRSASPTVGKVWLNGKRQLSLDKSAKQIGAPVAWARGFSGKGVTVAVLDTGYDTSHPDLAGVVTQSRDFTGSPDGVMDDVGHGTHVASTIAGRGTASKGKYVGVAKDAHLMVGRVCALDGCSDEAILAGMAWAADTGAKVVNMSLGGPPTEGTDPLSEAVEDLTASKGMLFVVAAGNDGMPESVGSPASADAALAVGSVDKKDELSSFSSTGPRVGATRRYDYAIKPDITAPGEAIVAARAARTGEGAPGAPRYTQLSGTSMATPHVAGAAAILVGQHPNWKPAQLKAALMSNAKFVKGQTVYEQGAGRVDLARATGQTLIATGSVDLGYFPYQDSGAVPAMRKVTYTNFGKSAVTLKVTLAVQDAAGKAAAKGMFAASAKSVTVPAGKAAKVSVTIKPSLGARSLYSGSLSAATADGKIRAQTAVGAYKEPKSYNVNYTAINPGPGHFLTELRLSKSDEDPVYWDAFQGSGIRRVPAGRYLASFLTYDLDAMNEGKVVSPTVDVQWVNVDKTVEVVSDARKRKPVTQTMDRPMGATQVGGSVLYLDEPTGFNGEIDIADGRLYAVPGSAASPKLTWGLATTLIAKGSSMSGTPATPFTYNLLGQGTGSLPAGKPIVHRVADLATITTTAHKQRSDEIRELSWTSHGGMRDSNVYQPVGFGARTQRTDYLSTSPKAPFSSMFVSGTRAQDGTVDVGSFYVSEDRVAVKGTKRSQTWNAAVFGPSFYAVDPASGSDGWRTGDDMYVMVPMRADAWHNGGEDRAGTGSTSVSVNGKVLHVEPTPGYTGFDWIELPARRSTVRISTVMDRAAGWRLSRHIELDWTFTSQTTSDEEATSLPLQVVRFRPVLDKANTAPAGTFTVPLVVQGVDPSVTAKIKKITVEVSYDEGKTWSNSIVSKAGDKQLATVTNPAGGTVSLRTVVTDPAGNIARQTIINAYTVR